MTPEARGFVRWALANRDLGPIRRAPGASHLAVFLVGGAPESMRAAPWWRADVTCWLLGREEWREHFGTDAPDGAAVVATAEKSWVFPSIDALARAVGLAPTEEGAPS